MIKNLLIAGVGGQGTVLASRLAAAAAMRRGKDARTTETIGMAQRGGTVVSHIRMGTGEFAPVIAPGTADLILAFEPGEAARALPYLAPDGMLIVCDSPIPPAGVRAGDYRRDEILRYIRENTEKRVIIDGGELLSRCASPRVMNVALLAAAAQSGELPFGAEDLEEAVRGMVAARYIEMNIRAISAGRSIYNEKSRTC